MATAVPFRGYDVICRTVGRRHASSWFTTFDTGDDQYAEERLFALETARQYAIELKDNPLSGRNLILMGTCGTGKDHLAVSVLRAAMSYGISAAYVRGSVLCSECRRSALENASDVPRKFKTVGLLVISDIEPNSTKPATDFEERAIMELVDFRYSEMLPVVVTTNKDNRSELSKAIGERTVDRLFDGAIRVPMIWPSHRRR